MAWLDPGQRHSKIHLNIPRHIPPNIHWNIQSRFYTPGRVCDESCLQGLRQSLYLERCSQPMNRHVFAPSHYKRQVPEDPGLKLLSRGDIPTADGTVCPAPELHWFSTQDFGRQGLISDLCVWSEANGLITWSTLFFCHWTWCLISIEWGRAAEGQSTMTNRKCFSMLFRVSELCLKALISLIFHDYVCTTTAAYSGGNLYNISYIFINTNVCCQRL